VGQFDCKALALEERLREIEVLVVVANEKHYLHGEPSLAATCEAFT
jgi:hypothetical protein